MPAVTCPWDHLAPASLRFCEAPVCGWVTEPANTWTNVGFVIVGLWVLARARRDGRGALGWIGVAAIATGVGSAFFHGTSSLAGQLVDQNVMLAETSLFVALNVMRWRRWPNPDRRLALVALGILAPSLLALVLVPDAGIALFALHVVVMLALELALALRDRGAIRYHDLAVVGLLFALAWGLWWLDKLGLACDPDQHVMTLHGVWHLLGAASFIFWYRHYRQVAARWTHHQAGRERV